MCQDMDVSNLRARFGTLGVSEIAPDMYMAYLIKLSLTHNPHINMERMNMLFERLVANEVDFDDSVWGIILLIAIPKEWSMVAQIYSQSNQTLATTTFLGVRDTIMAEFECSTHPSTLLHIVLVWLNIKASLQPIPSRPLLSQLLLKLPVMCHQVLPRRRPGEVGKVKKRRCML